MSVLGFRLEGSSMSPVYRPGGLALADTSARPRPGDCAVYSYRGRTLLHRVVSAGPGGAWLADDAGRIEPYFVPWGDVRGRVVSGGLLSRGIAGRLYSSSRRAVFRLLRK